MAIMFKQSANKGGYMKMKIKYENGDYQVFKSENGLWAVYNKKVKRIISWLTTMKEAISIAEKYIAEKR
jgi:helix-turn-helix protein